MFQWLFLTDYIRKLSMLFFICGLVSYWVDYRSAKQKSNEKREIAFSKSISLVYMIGSAAAMASAFIIPWFV